MSSRAPFQILVIPFRIDTAGDRRYCIFRRRDAGYWQAIAGGGEQGETPKEAAKREVFEEAGFSHIRRLVQLDTTSSIPVAALFGFLWGDDVPVVPEYSFGCEVNEPRVVLSKEHTEYRWTNYDDALQSLKWDSNKTALWELEYRISNGLL